MEKIKLIFKQFSTKDSVSEYSAIENSVSCRQLSKIRIVLWYMTEEALEN